MYLNLVLLSFLILFASSERIEAVDSVMVSKFLSDHRHSYDLIAILFKETIPEPEPEGTLSVIRNKIAGWFTKTPRTAEEIAEDIGRSLIVLEVDISVEKLYSIKEFYNVTTVPYLILMRNYDVLYQGGPDMPQVPLIIEAEVNKHEWTKEEENELLTVSNLLKPTSTVVETVSEGGIKKIITTNTQTVTEPELVVEIEPEEYDIAEYFAESWTEEPDEIAKLTARVRDSIHELKDVDEDNINVTRITDANLQDFIKSMETDEGALTHWVAVKKRVPVKYIPTYKSKIVQTVTTEELTDEKGVETADWDIDSGSAVYYKSIEDAKEDINRYTQLEESKVKSMSEHDNLRYSGDVVQTYEPVKLTYKQSGNPANIHKVVYQKNNEVDRPILGFREAQYTDELKENRAEIKEEIE